MLDIAPAPAAGLHALATDEERARAGRFHFAADRARFLGARGLLRALLGHYLAQPPAEVRLRLGASGKPSLDAPDPPLYFNVSHSGDWALVALARDTELGVDVEAARPLPDLIALAQRFFSPREAAELLGLDAARRECAFFRIWTRKEAFVKATGEGIVAGLDRFAVSHDDGTRVRLELFDAPDTAAQWTIRALAMPDGYAAALAVPRPSYAVQTWEWPAAEVGNNARAGTSA